jgi:hypothetical protein
VIQGDDCSPRRSSCPGLSRWHSSNPNARSLSHSPSAPPPSFTQYPYPLRSLVRDEQTHPHRPRLVVSHSTCPPLSSPPHANSFVICPAVIKHTHTHFPGTVNFCVTVTVMGRLVHTDLGSSQSSLIAHVLHSPSPPREQLCNRSCSNKTHISAT